MHAESEKSVEERSLIQGLAFYLAIVLRRWKLIAIVTGSAAGAVVIFSILTLVLPIQFNPMPTVYRAYAVIIVDEEQNQTDNPILDSFGIVDQASSGSNVTQLATTILRSRSFIDQLIHELDIFTRFEIDPDNISDARDIIIQKTDISYDSNTRELVISSIDPDRFFAEQLVNTTIRNLETWYREEGGSQSARRIQYLETTLEEVQAEIANIENQISDFQEQYNVLSVDELAETQNTMLNDLRTQLMQVNLDISNYTSISRVEDPALTRLRAQRNNIQRLINQIEEGYTDGDQRIPGRSELQDLKQQFDRLNMDLQIQLGIYETISQRYELEQISAVDSVPFYVLEYAEVPTEKSGPQRSQLCIIVTVGAFFAAIAFVLMHHVIQTISNDPVTRSYFRKEGN